MRRILLSVMTIGVVGLTAFSATRAFFSDTETSNGNVLSAGAIDLTIDSTAHYAGMICSDVTPDDVNNPVWTAESQGSSTRPDLLGDSCLGSWSATDLNQEQFFNLADIKPGDNGENTISMHVENNDAYMCAAIYNMKDDDPTLTEPETEAGDVTSGIGKGELSQQVRFFAWDDTNGNNIWESGETPLFSNTEGPASDVLGGVVYPLYGPQTTVFPGGQTKYVGLYWCYGNISTAGNVLSCDGVGGTNLTQTDTLSADIAFYVEQARNNGEFTCPPLSNFNTPAQ